MRRGKGSKGAPAKPFTPKELTSSLEELSCAMVRDPRDGPLPRRPIRMPKPTISPRLAGITLMGGGMLYTLAGMAPAGVGGLFGDPAFPQSGEFRILPEHASAPLGRLRVTAADSNLVIQLHATDGKPIYMGFVRAQERATLDVPAGDWKSLIVPTEIWDGTPTLVSDNDLRSMGTLKVVKGKQISITAANMSRIAEHGR